MTKNIQNEKIDKRAAALRDNLKRRKAKVKANKIQKKDQVKEEESNDGTTET